MVRKIKVVNICATEETTRADEDEQEQAIEPTETNEPEAAVDETTADTEEGAAVAESAAATAVEEPSPKPIDVNTTSKTIEQVSCPACGNSCLLKTLGMPTRSTAPIVPKRSHPLRSPPPMLNSRNHPPRRTSRRYR